MGGPREFAKPIVENCCSLETANLRPLTPGTVNRVGSLAWAQRDGQWPLAYVLNVGEKSGTCRLVYQIEGEKFDYTLRLTATSCHLGGARWWFSCPILQNDTPCGHRVRKLYLRSRCFGCRGCHGLGYKSQRESDKRVAAFLRNGTDPAMLCSPGRMSLPALCFATKVCLAIEKRYKRLSKRKKCG